MAQYEITQHAVERYQERFESVWTTDEIRKYLTRLSRSIRIIVPCSKYTFLGFSEEDLRVGFILKKGNIVVTIIRRDVEKGILPEKVNINRRAW